MKIGRVKGLGGLLFGLFIATSSGQGEYSEIVPFFNKYCVECHGPDKVEGAVRLNEVREIDAALWINIYEQMHYGDMPPAKAKQPSDELMEEMTELVDRISRDDRFTIATGFRRLNRREYRNTVNDLLGLSGEYYDPAGAIFPDDIEGEFDTNSMKLQINNDLLLEYLRSASKSLDRALFTEQLEKPKVKRYVYKPNQLKAEGLFAGTNNERAILRDLGRIYPQAYKSAVKATGKYKITAKAAGVKPQGIKNYNGRVLKMEFRAASAGTVKTLESFTLKDNKMGVFEAEVWLEQGALPYLHFPTGARKPRVVFRNSKIINEPSDLMALDVREMTIEGPLDVEWPPVSYKTTFMVEEMPDFENLSVRTEILRNFISRAFRRQVEQEELLRYKKYLDSQYKSRGSWIEAYKRTFAVIMASTDFLYIKENTGKLTGFELANRLSYFLWSTMPDMELFRLANSGEILNRDVYIAQLRRMILDPKAKSFVRSFASQWLSLDELGLMAPDEDDREYKVYYKSNLEHYMREETHKFFEHILVNNQPVTDFLDSDYTFLNEPLANLYNIPYRGGNELELVKLPKNSVRGGLLGHASIHAITSNGVETLPVERGMWVLNELMGIPPPPPPEEVPAIVPDLTHAKTAKDLLKAHREDPKCFSCHQHMDPPGLALESFDIIGRYRTSYGGRSRIDPSGKFMGSSFDDVRGLRKVLMSKKDTFTYNLIVKLAEYSKGRKLNRKDHQIVKRIAHDARLHDYKFMNIMGELLLSDLMYYR